MSADDLIRAVCSKSCTKLQKLVTKQNVNTTFQRFPLHDNYELETINLLHLAVENCNLSMIKLLLERGAMVLFTSCESRTEEISALTWCMENQQWPILQMLMQYARQNQDQVISDVILEHAYSVAFSKQDATAVMVMVHNHCKEDWHWNEMFVLHNAVRHNMASVVEYIVEQDADELLVANDEQEYAWTIAAAANCARF